MEGEQVTTFNTTTKRYHAAATYTFSMKHPPSPPRLAHIDQSSPSPSGTSFAHISETPIIHIAPRLAALDRPPWALSTPSGGVPKLSP